MLAYVTLHRLMLVCHSIVLCWRTLHYIVICWYVIVLYYVGVRYTTSSYVGMSEYCIMLAYVTLHRLMLQCVLSSLLLLYLTVFSQGR